MAHELDFNEATGQKAVFKVDKSGRNDMWHQEGIIIAESPDIETAIEKAGGKYEVITVPIYIKSRTNPTLFVKSPVGQVTLRTDRNTILGCVGDGYTPLQNIDMINVLKPLIDKGLIFITTGGTLRGGEDFWIQFKYNFDDPVIQEVYADKIIPYGTICNNHSGKRKGMLYNTDVEVVCMNTLIRSLSSRFDSIFVKHTASVNMRWIEAAERFWAGITDVYRNIAGEYQLMKSTILTVEQFTTTVLDTVAPIPILTKDNKRDGRTLAAVDRALDKRNLLTNYWNGQGTGITGNHTAWEANSSVTELVDHEENFIRMRKNTSRVESTLYGGIHDLKEEVYAKVLAVCKK